MTETSARDKWLEISRVKSRALGLKIGSALTQPAVRDDPAEIFVLAEPVLDWLLSFPEDDDDLYRRRAAADLHMKNLSVVYSEKTLPMMIRPDAFISGAELYYSKITGS